MVFILANSDTQCITFDARRWERPIFIQICFANAAANDFGGAACACIISVDMVSDTSGQGHVYAIKGLPTLHQT